MEPWTALPNVIYTGSLREIGYFRECSLFDARVFVHAAKIYKVRATFTRNWDCWSLLRKWLATAKRKHRRRP